MLAAFTNIPSDPLNVFLGDAFDDHADQWRRAAIH
jgi:hypothetical protein